MTTTEPAPGSSPSAAAEPQDLRAEAPWQEQHPVLQRLRPATSLGSGARSGAAWAMGAKVFAQFLQFLGTIATARLLTPDDYGKTAITVPILAFATIFTNLGLGSAIIHARRVTERLLSTAFWLNAVSGVVLTGLVAALSLPLAQLFRVPTLVPLLCLASLTFTFNLSIVQTSLLERTLRFKQIAVIETACWALWVATTVVAAIAGLGPYSLVLGPLAYQVSLTVAMWSFVRWRPRAFIDRESVRELWSFARGLTGYNILDFWSRNADNLLLARFASQADLGNYNRAYTLMKLPVIQMNTMMTRVLFPALTRLRDDRPRLGRAWLRALAASTAVVAPVSIGMAVAAPAMVEVLFGRRWLGMVTLLELLAASALPQTLTTTVGGLLRATGATTALFRLGVLTSVMSLAAMLIGLPWGAVGVATALTVKFYLEVLVSLPVCLRQVGLRWRDAVGALHGVWLGCVALAAAGIGVRLGLHGSVPAWRVLLCQIGVCLPAYVGMLALVDRPTLLGAVRFVRRLRAGRLAGTGSSTPLL